MGGCQNLDRRNVERSIFRNFQISNIKITKDELFDSFIIELIFFIFYKLFEQPQYLIIFQDVKYWFSKWKINKKFQIVKFF